jgi:nitrogenase molybdenum-iron protein beta chain
MSQNDPLPPEFPHWLQNPDATGLFGKPTPQPEFPDSEQTVDEIRAWMKSVESLDQNCRVESRMINSAQACQPLGAVFAAAGFEGALPMVHGPDNCTSFFHGQLDRHFKQPDSCISSASSDTADKDTIGSLLEAMTHACRSFQPRMIAISTACGAELVSEESDAFLNAAKQAGVLPDELDISYTPTPALLGSHLTGYDNQMCGILQHFWDGKVGTADPLVREASDTINIIGGFDGFALGNIQEIKRILETMGVKPIVLGETGGAGASTGEGNGSLLQGRTPLHDAAQALHAKATLSLQEYCTEKTLGFIAAHGQQTLSFNYPIGVGATDGLILALSRITGKAVPRKLEAERGRLVDAIADASTHLHGKSFALYGDPDTCLGLTGFLLELGVKPKHVVSSNGSKAWAEKIRTMLDFSAFGAQCHVYPGKDLFHLRDFLFTDPVDFLIGNSYGRALEQETGTPLIRIGFPILDRQHHQHSPILGYQGGLNVLSWILDKVFGETDRYSNVPSKTDYSFDIIR